MPTQPSHQIRVARHLERRMMDAKPVPAHRLQLSQYVVRVLASLGDLHARREHHLARRERPDVEVLDRRDVGPFAQRRAHRARVDQVGVGGRRGAGEGARREVGQGHDGGTRG